MYNGMELSKYLYVVADGFDRSVIGDRTNTTVKVGHAVGETFLDTTKGMRKITMPFYINKDIPDALEKIAQIVNVEEPKQLIFGDEPDWYYSAIIDGTLSFTRLEREGSGTITWLVPDMYKHAVNSTTYSNDGANKSQILFTNNSNAPTPVNVEVDMKGDNGFIGLVLNNNIYQVGIPQQVDGVKYDDAEVLINNNPQLDPSTALLNDTKFVTVPTDQWKPRKQGAVALITPESQPKGRILIHSDTGPQPSTRMPVETSITYKLPTDKTTNTEGAKSFSFRFILGFHSYDPFDSGQIVATVHSKDGKAMASILMQDLYVGKEDYVLQYHVDNQKVYEVKPNIWMLNSDYPNYSIVKYNEKITLASPWQTKTIIAPQLKDVEAYYVSFSFLKWFPYKTPTIYEVTDWNFWEGYADLYHDTPNYFKKDDVLTIKSASNKVYINGILSQDAVDIGSRPLIAECGDNALGIVYSQWVKTPPDVKITFNERKL